MVFLLQWDSLHRAASAQSLWSIGTILAAPLGWGRRRASLTSVPLIRNDCSGCTAEMGKKKGQPHLSAPSPQ